MAGLKLSSKSSWRWAAASSIGTSHLQSSTECQDAFAVARLDYNSRLKASSVFAKECVGAIVSDGAGSAKYGLIGAQTACLMLLNFMSSDVDKWMTREGLHVASRRIPRMYRIEKWISDTRKTIGKIANRNQSTSREFASTVAGIAVTPDGFAAWQIGDCTIVGRRNNRWEILCWPEEGEFASATYFLTDEPKAKIKCINGSNEYDAFALFSDGIKNLALDLKSKSAHYRFFSPIFRQVDCCRQSGKLLELSKRLEGFLKSRRVCERTDDDKTLVLLSRR